MVESRLVQTAEERRRREAEEIARSSAARLLGSHQGWRVAGAGLGAFAAERWSMTRVKSLETPCMSKIASFKASRDSVAAISRERFSVSWIRSRSSAANAVR